MTKVKKSLEIIKYNLWSLVGFQIIFKFLSLMIFTPLFLNGFNLIMKLTGYKYLTLENIFSFLSNPITFFMLILLIILMTFYAMFDITNVIIILDASVNKEKIRVIDSIKISLKKCLSTLNIKNFPLAFFVLFLIPFLNIGISSSFITTIKIPEFINEFIINNKIYLLIWILFIIGLIILLFRWLYSLHYFVLENLSFRASRQKSIALSHKKHFKDILSLLVIQFVIFLIYFLLIGFGIFIIYLINKFLNNIIVLKSIATTIIWVFIAISFIIFMALTVPISYAGISTMFYIRKKEKGEEIKHIKVNYDHPVKVSPKLIKLIVIFILLSIIGGSIFTYGLYKGKYNFNIEYVRTQEVTAHRGASLEYPENTMLAFKRALEFGADWIELDVGATKDNELIVIHDTNLKRTTGLNKNIYELDYAEIKDLDAGSFLNPKFKDARIPLLKEVILWAQENNIKLNIELKPTGHEEDLEKSVIDIINNFNFKNECVITSQTYEVLEKVKKYDKDIETVYVMSLAYGDITSLKYADHFSIEGSNITSSLVKKIHKEGKKIYAWTINSKENVEKMINLNVDNVITDNIGLARTTIYSSKTSNVINEYIKFVYELLN